MTPSKPLAGKRIVVTRAPEHSHELVRDLRMRGAEVLSLPTVGRADPPDPSPLNEAVRRLEDFDAILFVSKTAVEETYKRAGMLGKQDVIRELPGRLVAAVGPATARAADRHGIVVDYVASDATGESLVRELGRSLAGRHVFLPRSDRGDKRLLQALREVGASVTEVVAYATIVPEALDLELVDTIRRAEVDVIIFASPSAFHNLGAAIEPAELARLSTRIRFAAIGPITTEAIRKRGGRVDIVAREPSSRGLTDAIVKYYEGSALRPTGA
jgi:uroporphyrinogen-III synthase